MANRGTWLAALVMAAMAGWHTQVRADAKDDMLRAALKDQRDRLLYGLKDVPGGQWQGKANACDVWNAMDKSQRYVFLTHTDLLGQRSLFYNYPMLFGELEYCRCPDPVTGSCPASECTESGGCTFMDDMGQCRTESGWSCYYAGKCWIERGAPNDYTMALQHVNRILWIAGSCPWPTRWVEGGYCVDTAGNYTGPHQCSGGDNNRLFYEADPSLMGMFRNRDYGLPMWDKSNDVTGPHKGFTNTSETVHGRRNGQATGQTHFFAWDTDPNNWVEGRTLWSRFCNERNVGAACTGSVYGPDWAGRLIEQDCDYDSTHESSPVCYYSPYLGYQKYDFVWTNQVTANNAALDYDPCASPYCPAGSPPARFISESAPPSSMQGGQAAAVSVTFANCSGQTWRAALNDWDTTGFKIGSQSPQDNGNWGVGRVRLPNDVGPGALVTVNFTARAPSGTTGYYGYQWGVLNEGVSWYSEFSPAHSVYVAGCTPSTSCAAQGKSCGQLWNGCQYETCGSYGGGCPSGQSCSNNVCQASGGGAYWCYSPYYPWNTYGYQTWICNPAYMPAYCYTIDWQWTTCPLAGGGAVCGNGLCEAGENGSSCGQDCCDQYTACGQTRQNGGQYYCRNMYHYEYSTGYAYWHGFTWMTAGDATLMCDEAWEAQEGSVNQTQYQCGGYTGKCHGIPGGYY